MVRGSIEHTKMPPDDNAPKYEDFHIGSLPWSVFAVFGRFCYGKMSNLHRKSYKFYIFIKNTPIIK